MGKKRNSSEANKQGTAWNINYSFSDENILGTSLFPFHIHLLKDLTVSVSFRFVTKRKFCSLRLSNFLSRPLFRVTILEKYTLETGKDEDGCLWVITLIKSALRTCGLTSLLLEGHNKSHNYSKVTVAMWSEVIVLSQKTTSAPIFATTRLNNDPGSCELPSS